jgi:PHYB activation tagged suppressor 1
VCAFFHARRRPIDRAAGSERAAHAVVMWRAWWPWPWQQGALAAAVWLCLHVAAGLMEALWWRPRRLERHFARQGVRGPGYRFFFGSSIALIRLMVDASSRPAPPDAPHDVLPRVLAFYRHWRNLYGKLTHHVKST